MKKRRVWLWTAGGVVVLVAGVIVGGLGILGRLPWQSGKVYEDPQGRFTMETDPSWEQVETDGSYTQFKVPEPPVNIYIQILDASTVDEAFSQAMETLGFDTGLLSGDSVTTYGDWNAYQQDDSAGITYGLAGQIVGDNAMVMIVKTDKPSVSVENADILRALMSIKIAGQEEMVLDTFTDVEAVVQKEVDRLAGSSLSIAVVHEGEIVYTYTYGQANPAQGIAADSQTIFQYRSMTKVVTASALMQLVEKGLVDLEAWPGEYIPEFPESWKVTVRQLLTPLGMEPTSFPFVEADERYAKDQYPADKIDGFVAELNDYRGPGQDQMVLQNSEPFVTLNDYQILPPWGGLRGTPADLTHFVQMHLNGGRYGDAQILKPETVAAMQEMQFSTDSSPLGFGLSWWIGEDDFSKFYFHVGNGAGSEGTLRIYPDLGVGVVVMSNSRGYQRDKIVGGLVNAWLNQK